MFNIAPNCGTINEMIDIKQEVYKEIKNVIGDDINFNDDSLVKEDLGIDSYKAVNILLNLDKKQISFKSDNLPYIKTVKDLLDSLTYYGK